jgi:hypothetical protein
MTQGGGGGGSKIGKKSETYYLNGPLHLICPFTLLFQTPPPFSSKLKLGQKKCFLILLFFFQISFLFRFSLQMRFLFHTLVRQSLTRSFFLGRHFLRRKL